MELSLALIDDSSLGRDQNEFGHLCDRLEKVVDAMVASSPLY